jgi:hypothetical protein
MLSIHLRLCLPSGLFPSGRQQLTELMTFIEPQGSNRDHKSPPLLPILNQTYPVHILLFCFKIHFNSILPSKLTYLTAWFHYVDGVDSPSGVQEILDLR